MASEKLGKLDDEATLESEIIVPQIQKKSGKKGKLGGEKKGIDEGELSLDEISNLRQNAQQQSIDTIKGLEEMYQKAKDKMGQGIDTVSEKTRPLKDTLADKTQQAKEYTLEKAVEVNQTVQKVGDYLGEKSFAAKDRAVGVGTEAKDRAAVGGLGVAEYMAEKMAQGTKASADVGEKAGAAKDTMMVESAESERLRMEENKRSGGEYYWKVGEGGGGSEVFWDEDDEQQMMRGGQKGGGGGGWGILQAIGETLVEIGQTAMNLLFGSGESEQGQGYDKSYEKKY